MIFNRIVLQNLKKYLLSPIRIEKPVIFKSFSRNLNYPRNTIRNKTVSILPTLCTLGKLPCYPTPPLLPRSRPKEKICYWSWIYLSNAGGSGGLVNNNQRRPVLYGRLWFAESYQK